jgi:UDP-GlcNAc:undecaprenyl-phosphate GlcNAc-1-phosphate transferase
MAVYLVLVLAAFGLAAVLTRILSVRLRILDVPNERSSHVVATPRGGGLAIVLAFAGCMASAWLAGFGAVLHSGLFFGFCVAALIIAGVSLYDDLYSLPVRVRFLGQFAAVALAMYAGMVVERMPLPLLGELELGAMAYPLTLLWMVGLVNTYNFLDGLDGFAASTAVIAAAFLAGIAGAAGSELVLVLALVLSAASGGFLVFNWQPARIFMGDVGSTFIGFSFAAIAVIAAAGGAAAIDVLVVPLLLLHFIFDALFTFVRRLLAGENVLQGHRTHIYQLLNRMGWSHRRVATAYAVAAVLQGVAAIWMVENAGEESLGVFIPFVIAYAVVARQVVRRAVARKILG